MTFTINPDTPEPDCAIVDGSQRLRIVNATNAFKQHGKALTVYFAGVGDRKLDLGKSTTYEPTFATYLAPGQHILRVSYFGDNANMIVWLR